MIPLAYINEWRDRAPWATQAMVEQDLLLCRILIVLFDDPTLRDALIFRGGTALHKLCFQQPLRYSEDIDLVQREPGPIGPVFDTVRRVLGDWLGTKPARKQGPGVVNLVYRLNSEDIPPSPIRIKIEINTREHFQALPLREASLAVSSRWFSGESLIPIYATEELLATKLRALYQRRKGRDLFDLAAALRELSPHREQVVGVFQHYMEAEGQLVTRAQFSPNLATKLAHPGFAEDCLPLLRPGTPFDLHADASLVEREFLALLPDAQSTHLSTPTAQGRARKPSGLPPRLLRLQAPSRPPAGCSGPALRLPCGSPDPPRIPAHPARLPVSAW